MGDIQGKPNRPNLGDTVGALASYRKAQTLLKSLLTASPNNLEARRILSLSYQSIGRVQQRNSDWQNSLESQRNAIEISDVLIHSDPHSAHYRNLAADNYRYFGEALYSTGRGATIADHHVAIEYFRKALTIHSSLATEDPVNAEFNHAVGVDYEYVGIAYIRLGDMTGDPNNYQVALENHLKEKEINEAISLKTTQTH